MVKVRYFGYKTASAILEEKGLWPDLVEIVYGITDINHDKIQRAFLNKGWETEKYILPETTWAWDAYKDKVVVSIEFSLIDAVHRDFFRLLMWHHGGKLDAVVYITTTFKEPKFHNVKRDIEICHRKYPHLLPYPIFLIGLEE